MNNSIYINYNLLLKPTHTFVMQFVNWTKTYQEFDQWFF